MRLPPSVRGSLPTELQPIQKSKIQPLSQDPMDLHSFGAVFGGCFGTRLAVAAEWGLRCEICPLPLLWYIARRVELKEAAALAVSVAFCRHVDNGCFSTSNRL
jgi:hypothetical protein